MKNYCAWCFLPLHQTEEEYNLHGNMCSKCSGRADRCAYAGVYDRSRKQKETDKELLKERKKNIRIYGIPWERTESPLELLMKKMK
jgi:hypothetical protein